MSEIENNTTTAPEAHTEQVNETVQVNFQPQNFVSSLKYMGAGMLGIFIVIAVIIACTAVLNKIFKK